MKPAPLHVKASEVQNDAYASGPYPFVLSVQEFPEEASRWTDAWDKFRAGTSANFYVKMYRIDLQPGHRVMFAANISDLRQQLSTGTSALFESMLSSRKTRWDFESDAEAVLVWLDEVEHQGFGAIKDLVPGAKRPSRLPFTPGQGVKVTEWPNIAPQGYRVFTQVLRTEKPGGFGVNILASIFKKGAGRDEKNLLNVDEVGNVGGMLVTERYNWRTGEKNPEGRTKILRVNNAYVRPDFQRQGLGPVLLETFYAEGYRLGARDVEGGVHSTPASRMHQAVSAKHGLKYRAVTMRDDEPDTTQDLSYDERYTSYGYPLEGLSGIKDIPKGRTRNGERDYSAVLPEAGDVRKKYQLTVEEKPYSMDGSTFTAFVTVRKTGNVVGQLRGYTKPNGPYRVLTVEEVEVDAAHRGIGLGRALYEALYKEAHDRDGVTIVTGGTHSTMASRVHESLANKHNWEYSALPNNESNGGDWPDDDWEAPLINDGRRDDRWQRYAYKLKGVDPLSYPQQQEKTVMLNGLGNLPPLRGLASAESNCKPGTVAFQRLELKRQKCVRTKASTPGSLIEVLQKELKNVAQEHAGVILLNTRNEVISVVEVGIGGLDSLPVDPRVVFGAALTAGAPAVVLYHNHPSGNSEPSPQDVNLTNQLSRIGKQLGVLVLDHLIITPTGYTSFQSRGLMPA